MKLRHASASLTCVAVALLMQACVESYPSSAFNPQPPQPPEYPPQNAEAASPQPVEQPASRAPNADDTLVAPIALYPDPLIALILPASTAPADINAASSYLVQYGDPTGIDSQPWDPSVRALAHYPTVVTWMAQNMAWTEALGSAFLSSPNDVMDAVQRLRARALAAGSLASTSQQQVYSEGGQIEIYPAQPDSVYVPVYDDSVVYADGGYDGYNGPFINFGNPYPAGPWLSFYFDWGHHRVWAGDHNVWRAHDGWQPPHAGGNGTPPGAHAWRPSGRAPRNPEPTNPSRGTPVPHPRSMPGAPGVPPDHFRKPTVQRAETPQAPQHTPQAKAVTPQAGPARSNGAGTLPISEESHHPAALQPRFVPPPPPPRANSSAFPRGAEPAAPHSAPAHSPAPAPAQAPAPAPAPNSNNQQPQK
jgi:hypothetical protein